MSTDQLSSSGTNSLAASANHSHDVSATRNSGSAKATTTTNSSKSVASVTHASSSSSSSPHGSNSNSSAHNYRQENNNTNSQTRTSGAGGPRKNSAERSIAHTRMDDESVQQEYIYGHILGEGSFGKVYRAQHRATGEVVAIKEIVKEKAGSSGLKQLDKEVSIFKKVDHKNIIKLKEVLESPKKMYLIMEVCEGGDLAKLLQKRQHLNEADTKQVMFSLAEAIKYLHQVGILHRDLKLENLLLAEEPVENGVINIKVSDFGLSTQQNNNSYENMQEQYCGTPSYMAPEMNSTYSYPVDVWAMGIIMYYLLTKYPKDNELNESIAKDGPKFNEPQWENVSEQAKKLLQEMLTINPAYRLSSGELLNHEWFTGKKREHGNVLELMKEYRLEKQALTGGETVTQHGGQKEGTADSSAINGNASTSFSKDPDKQKGPRKGSGGKKASGGDSLKAPPTSTHLKPQSKKSSGPSMTPSPRPPSKTPTPKEASIGNRTSMSSTKTTATKTTSKTLTSSSPNGPSVARAGQSSALPKTAVVQKAKKK